MQYKIQSFYQINKKNVRFSFSPRLRERISKINQIIGGIMKNNKSSKSLSILAAGSLMLGAVSGLSAGTAAGNALGFSSLGSGAEIREVIMNVNSAAKAPAELKCAAGKDKSAEGKCGDKKETTKKNTDVQKTKKVTETKTTEAKCGEGKCGEGKCGDKVKKEAASSDSSKVQKDKKAKTAEGKCGS